MNPYPWFDTIGRTEAEAPCFFAASLVEQIGKTPGQEIGSHTFCHYYCREKGQTLEQFAADLRAARAMGAARGYDLQSIVLPRNQCEPEYVRVMRECGFTAYRDEENDWIHEKIKFARCCGDFGCWMFTCRLPARAAIPPEMRMESGSDGLADVQADF